MGRIKLFMTIPEELFKEVKEKGYKGLNDYMDIINWLENEHGVFVYVKPYNNEFQQIPRFMWVVENLRGIKGIRTSFFIAAKNKYKKSCNAYIKGLKFAIREEL